MKLFHMDYYKTRRKAERLGDYRAFLLTLQIFNILSKIITWLNSGTA